MNTKTQLLFDKLMAKPLAFLLNFLVRIVGKLLRIDHTLERDYQTIVVSKFKGMGSILQASPLLIAIKRKYPNAHLIFVSSAANQSILEKIDPIDQIITVDDRSLLKFIRSNASALLKLLRIRPQLYIDLEVYSDYSTLFTLFTLSINRVGFYLRSSSFRTGIYTHMMFFNPRVPISKVYLQLAYLIGCPEETIELYPIHQHLKPESILREYIVINPNASDLRLERKWGKENVIALIERIVDFLPDCDVYLVGSPAESAYTEEIAVAVNHPNVYNRAGKTSIDTLIGLIANARLMISNDTGPMHIAFCTKTPIICLFGPCSPEQYGTEKTAHIIYKKVYCSPCVHDFEVSPCKGNNVCMQLITVDEVFEYFSAIYTGIPVQQQVESGFIFKVGGNALGKVYR